MSTGGKDLAGGRDRADLLGRTIVSTRLARAELDDVGDSVDRAGRTLA